MWEKNLSLLQPIYQMLLLVYWALIGLFLVLQLQRLSDVGDESVIVTANISDDTTSVLGIDKFISCFTATETI